MKTDINFTMTAVTFDLCQSPAITLPWRMRDGRPLRRDIDLLRTLLIAIAEGRCDIPSDEDTVKFHLGLMVEAGLLRGRAEWLGQEIPRTIQIEGISWQGYDFLAAIRQEAVWQRIKSSLSKIGGQAAFDVIVALGVAAGKQLTGIQP